MQPTTNTKQRKYKVLFPHNIRIITLNEAGIDINIPEPHVTLEENAAEKGRTIFALPAKIVLVKIPAWK